MEFQEKCHLQKAELRFLAVCRAGMEKFIMFLQRLCGRCGQDTELSKKSKEKEREGYA